MKTAKDRAAYGNCLRIAFGFRLKLSRDRKLLSQRELARKVDTNAMAVWKWENGKSFPTTAVLISVCHVLEVSADYLLGVPENYTPVDFLKC